MKFNPSVAWTKIVDLSNGLIAALPNVLIALFVFAVFYYGARQIRNLVSRLTDTHRKTRSVGLVLGRLAQGCIILIGALVSLTVVFPSFKAGSLINLLGLTSVAFGFAFRDIFQNFLAGILLLLAEPFRIGDQIVVNNFEGTVQEIQTRATTIQTYDGRRVVIPNTELFTEAVTVNTAYEMRRCEYDVGIGYGDDVAQAKTLMQEAVRSVEGVLADPPPETALVGIGASSLNIRVWWWVQPPARRNVLMVQDRVLMAIKQTLTDNGIDIPYATQTVLFHDQTEETDGDRARQREGWPAGAGTMPRPARLVAAPLETNNGRNHAPERGN